MTFLLAKIVVLLLMALLLGLWLGRWSVRRHYDDVTTEYTRLQTDWQGWRQSFEDKLLLRPSVDLQPVKTKISDVETLVRGLPKPADLEPVLEQLQSLEAAFKNTPQPAAPDLKPVLAAVSALQMPTPQELDLSETHARLGAIEALLHDLPAQIQPQPLDTSLQERLVNLENAIHSLQIPPVDLTSTESQLAALLHAVNGLAVQPAIMVDLTPVMEKLALLEARTVPAVAPVFDAPAPPAPAPAQTAEPNHPNVRVGSRNLLTQAVYGPPDDLQLIKGVAEVLERMLHEIGVYYFWQIAEWTPADVRHADAQLPVFKGRIERDHWIEQSKQYAQTPGFARKPDELNG
jgi:predicted flap endonuclease-1-like 5' DNA nuclease